MVGVAGYAPINFSKTRAHLVGYWALQEKASDQAGIGENSKPFPLD